MLEARGHCAIRHGLRTGQTGVSGFILAQMRDMIQTLQLKDVKGWLGTQASHASKTLANRGHVPDTQ